MRTAKFDGIALGELSVNFIEAPAKIVAKGAFISRQGGQTHGWTTNHQWSTETIEKLRELRQLMERDMEAIHFADAGGLGAVAPTTGGGSLADSFKGLGERLGATDDGVPQT